MFNGSIDSGLAIIISEFSVWLPLRFASESPAFIHSFIYAYTQGCTLINTAIIPFGIV